MQDFGDGYRRIFERGQYIVQSRLLINGVEYGEDKIMSLSINNSVFSETHPVVGSAVSGEIDAEIIATSAEIPRMAKLVPQYRLYENEDSKSNWFPKGTYFIDTRSEDFATHRLTIHGYDCMMMTEKPFTDAQINNWGNSKTDNEVVTMIVNSLNSAGASTQRDQRTVLGKNYIIPKPLKGDGAESMRDYLRYIAAAYGGNWVITFDNRLLLLKLNGIPNETSYLVDNFGNPITFGGVKIVI